MKSKLKPLIIEMIKKIIEEEVENNAPIKIKYMPVTKRVYTTTSTGIEFKVSINGISATGYWSPCRGRYISNGVDINVLYTSDGRGIKIYDGGGSYKTYEISADLEEAPRQPKNLRFTGPLLKIDNLKPIFVNKIKHSLQNQKMEPKLSDQFLQYFGYK